MPNPKKRHSRAKRDRRRSQWRLMLPNLGECPQCHSPKLPHRICPECGFYNGELILPKKEKKKSEEKTETAK